MSEFIGNVGEHIALEVVSKGYVHRNDWKENQNLILFEDKNGNIVSIMSACKFKPGDKWTIDGRIRQHSFFNGQKQTHLCNWGLMFAPRPI
jgi:hypothetical protein